jgi:hypothetical protein
MILTLIVGLTVPVRPAQSAGPTVAATPVQQPAKTPQAIEPRVQQVLNSVCTELSKPKEYSYHAEITFDSVLPSLVKLQYAAAMDATIVRPNRLTISYQSDLGAKNIWYNGKTLTIFDPAQMAYATIAVPDTIDAMLEEAANDKNLSIPLKGFDVSNPCAVIYKQVLRSKYVGINDAAGIDCDHLAFIQQDADWQVWITRGKKPLPRKVVITYKKLPTQPQWEAVLSNWRFDQEVPASLFQPKIPKGAIKTEFMGSKEK